MIKNRITGKRYIGESIDIKRRWQEHRRDLQSGKHHCKRLQQEWNKYGDKAFKFRIVEKFWFTKLANADKLKIALLLREGYWMDVYNSLLDYNTEDSIGDLKKFADMGRGNPKFKRYDKYRKFIRDNIVFAKRWFPHIAVATLYNRFVKAGAFTVLILVAYYLWRCIMKC